MIEYILYYDYEYILYHDLSVIYSCDGKAEYSDSSFELS